MIDGLIVMSRAMVGVSMPGVMDMLRKQAIRFQINMEQVGDPDCRKEEGKNDSAE
jgi:hypothetical protein